MACASRNDVLTSLSDGGVDDAEGPDGSHDTRVCDYQGRQIPVGMRFATESGNEGTCRCVGSVCEATTTLGVPRDAGAGVPAWPTRCSPTSPCAIGKDCYYDPGCNQEDGYCAYAQTPCSSAQGDPVEWAPTSAAPPAFCGCNGTTYVAKEAPYGFGCPLVPYSHVGACP